MKESAHFSTPVDLSDDDTNDITTAAAKKPKLTTAHGVGQAAPRTGTFVSEPLNERTHQFVSTVPPAQPAVELLPLLPRSNANGIEATAQSLQNSSENPSAAGEPVNRAAANLPSKAFCNNLSFMNTRRDEVVLGLGQHLPKYQKSDASMTSQKFSSVHKTSPIVTAQKVSDLSDLISSKNTTTASTACNPPASALTSAAHPANHSIAQATGPVKQHESGLKSQTVTPAAISDSSCDPADLPGLLYTGPIGSINFPAGHSWVNNSSISEPVPLPGYPSTAQSAALAVPGQVFPDEMPEIRSLQQTLRAMDPTALLNQTIVLQRQLMMYAAEVEARARILAAALAAAPFCPVEQVDQHQTLPPNKRVSVAKVQSTHVN
jgi:hypothetical protein